MSELNFGFDVPQEILPFIAQDEEYLQLLQVLSATSYMIILLVAQGQRIDKVAFAVVRPILRYKPSPLEMATELMIHVVQATDKTHLYQEGENVNLVNENFLAIATLGRNTCVQSRLIDYSLDVSQQIRSKRRFCLKSQPLPTIKQAIDKTRSTARFRYLVGISSDTAVRQVLEDGKRLQSIIWNLIFKAVNFTSTKEHCWVYLERTRREHIHSISRQLLSSPTLNASYNAQPIVQNIVKPLIQAFYRSFLLRQLD